MKKAFITGITGQDGAYLAQFLLEKGYAVYGMRRRVATDTTQRLHTLIEQYVDRFFLVYGDMTDASSIFRLISSIQPDEIYNLAAQSDVAVSFEVPEYTAQADGVGVLHILEAVRTLKLEQKVKIYQASSSELFGKVQTVPQNECTPFYPRSPYAVAKLYAYWIMVNYREGYNLFACNGVLFNHESPLRGENFVTRKIVQGVAQLLAGKQEVLLLGNLDARRDWGFAQDYVEAMWLMLQQETADDFVIATGISYSVREFVEHAFEHVGISLVWQGVGLAEKGVDRLTGKTLVAVDEKFFRPTEVDYLLGDATKARTVLGWQPKTSFKDLVKLMMDAELKEIVKPLPACEIPEKQYEV